MGAINLGFEVGINAGRNSGTADTAGKTNSTMRASQQSRAFTDTVSSTKTTGKSLQLNYENRSVKSLLDKIDQHLQRLDECESFGAFDCAAYVIADNRETSLMAASNYNAGKTILCAGIAYQFVVKTGGYRYSGKIFRFSGAPEIFAG